MRPTKHHGHVIEFIEFVQRLSLHRHHGQQHIRAHRARHSAGLCRSGVHSNRPAGHQPPSDVDAGRHAAVHRSAGVLSRNDLQPGAGHRERVVAEHDDNAGAAGADPCPDAVHHRRAASLCQRCAFAAHETRPRAGHVPNDCERVAVAVLRVLGENQLHRRRAVSVSCLRCQSDHIDDNVWW